MINKVVPTAVLKDNRLYNITDFTMQDQMKILKHSKNLVNIEGRPLYEKYIDNSLHRIVIYGGNITEQQYKQIQDYAYAKGLYILVNSKDFLGGTSRWSQVYLSKRNIGKEFLIESDIYEEFMCNINDLQKVKRHEKLLGTYIEMPIKPKVLVGPKHVNEGYILVSRDYVNKINKYFKDKNIDFKLMNCSKTAKILKSNIYIIDNLKDYDVIVPADENKFKLSAEKISKNFSINPSINSYNSFSRNLKDKFTDKIGRQPRLPLDSCCFLDVSLNSSKVEIFKNMIEGNIEKESIANALFSYQMETENENGESTFERKYNLYGEQLMQEDKSLLDSDIWDKANPIIGKAVIQHMIPKMKGVYGKAMPSDLLPLTKGKKEVKVGSLFRFPLMTPVRCTTTICNDIIYVPKDLWTVIGGDFDGDDVNFQELDSMPVYFNWDKESDRRELTQLLQMPVKNNQKEKIKLIDAQMIVNKQASLIGKIYNANKIVIGGYIYSGKLSMKDIIKIDIYNNATLTQQAINGLKHSTSSIKEEVNTDFIQKYNFDNKHIFGIHQLPELSENVLNKAKYFYNLIKYPNNITDIINGSRVASPTSPYWFEREVSKFRSWKKI